MNELDARIAFLLEADRLKSVNRASYLTDRSRHENSAEHSWHIALFAMVLEDEAPEGVDISRVIRMLILHDLVEIDAGDAPIHGRVDVAAMTAREEAAAARLFGMLPPAQGAAFRALWEEFEAARTPDARFAKALDRFQPPVLNLATDGGSWPDFGVTEDMITARVAPAIQRGAPALWQWLAPRIRAWFSS